jgi:hypothetical protein
MDSPERFRWKKTRRRYQAADADGALEAGRCRRHPDRAVAPGADRCAVCVKVARSVAEPGPPDKRCPQHPARRLQMGRTLCGECLKAQRAPGG